MTNVLEVKVYRNKFAIFSGKSRLSRLFKTEDLAKKELNNNSSFYEYWGGSAGVSVENSTPIVVDLTQEA